MDFLQSIPISTLFILSLAGLISLLTTVVNRALTNPEKMKQTRKEVSEWNKQLREARRENDKKNLEKLMKKQQYMMQLQSKMMWQSMKVSLLFLVPLFLMWQLLGGYYGLSQIAYLPGIGSDLPLPLFSNSLIWWYLLCSIFFGTALQHAFRLVEVSE